MSSKPLKASDQKKLSAEFRRKQKQIETQHTLPPYTIVFSEGTKTEPNYIKGLTRQVNAKYAQYTSGDRIIVIGTGRNTSGLLEYTRRRISESYPEYQHIYLMYDKDDFPLDNFDNTAHSAVEKRSRQKYHAIWSNECIELWFLLHFQSLESNLGREQYHEILKRYIPYEKNSADIFERLTENTEIAIQRSRELLNSYPQGTPPSQCTPATRVHELVEALLAYL